MAKREKSEKLRFGCARCYAEDADAAHEDMLKKFEGVAELAFESHFSLHIIRCPDCGQQWVYVWTERINWSDGHDTISILVVPIREAEAKKLIALGDESVPAIERFGRNRRVLNRYSAGGETSWWTRGSCIVPAWG